MVNWAEQPKQRHIINVRHPNKIRERASVEGGVWHAQSLQLALHVRLCSEYALGLFFRYASVLRRNEQLNTCFLGGRAYFHLDIKGSCRNCADDDVHTGQGVLDGLLVGIVDLDHLGVSFNRLGGLCVHNEWCTQHITYNNYWMDTLPRE